MHQPIRLSLGIVTPHLPECRDFYVGHFGFQVAADLQWYIQLRSPDGTYNLGFVLPNRPELDTVFQQPFTSGKGVYLGIEVQDVRATLASFQRAGVPIASSLRDEAWGERHFVIRDPAGCLVNVWQRISDSEQAS